MPGWMAEQKKSLPEDRLFFWYTVVQKIGNQILHTSDQSITIPVLPERSCPRASWFADSKSFYLSPEPQQAEWAL